MVVLDDFATKSMVGPRIFNTCGVFRHMSSNGHLFCVYLFFVFSVDLQTFDVSFVLFASFVGK